MTPKPKCICEALSREDPKRAGVPAVLVTGGREITCPVHKTAVPSATQARIAWAERIAGAPLGR